MKEIIVQAGYMSGDMFGVAAALKLSSDVYVLIVHDDSDKSNTTKMQQLYLSSVKDFSRDTDRVAGRDRSTGMTSPRVQIEKVANSRNFYKSMHDEAHPDRGANLVTLYKKFPGLTSSNSIIKAMGRSTAVVKYHFNRNSNGTRRALIQQWEIHDFDELSLQRFLNRRGIIHGKKYLFLWIRQSGKGGGAHPELDASRKGWQEIIDNLPAEIIPVAIGDKFGTNKLTYSRGPMIDLTNFWEDIPFCLYKHPKFVGAEARLSQFALFDYMNRAGYNYCHIGMRSGVLESVALMGSNVTYMEEVGNPQQSRIEELSKSMSNFDRLALSKLPTATGQVIDRNQKTDRSTLYNPHIRAISKHCQEEFPVIAKRISSVESSVRVGAPETDYFNKFIELSAPVWLPKYGDVSNWPAYKKKVPRWSTQLEGLISSLYRATWSKQGMTPGFAGRDLSKILRQVNAMFARPRN